MHKSTFAALLLAGALALPAAPALAQAAKGKKPAPKTAKSAAKPAPATAAPTSEQDRLSYVIGHLMGQQIQHNGVTVNPDVVSRALADELRGTKSTLSDEETQRVMNAYQQQMQVKAEAQQQQAAAGNLAAGQAFLAENGKKPGVQTLSSGLQYLVEREGSGTPPGPTDRVKVHYRGTLLNGKEFDSSYSRGQPIELQTNQVIKGWTEALQLMKPGAKWKLFIPANLAYGNAGAGADIEPGSTLLFDVELLEVMPAAK